MVYISGGNELLDPMKILTKAGVQTGSVVADLGCGGAGHFVIPAAKLVGEKTIVYAVDILRNVLKSVTSIGRLEGIHNIKPIWADLEHPGSVKIPAKSLDVALIINMLFLSKNHQAVLTEAVRLLKPTGRLLVVDWAKSNAVFGPKPADRIDFDKIKKIGKDLDLKLIGEFDAGQYHHGLIFGK